MSEQTDDIIARLTQRLGVDTISEAEQVLAFIFEHIFDDDKPADPLVAVDTIRRALNLERQAALHLGVERGAVTTYVTALARRHQRAHGLLQRVLPGDAASSDLLMALETLVSILSRLFRDMSLEPTRDNADSIVALARLAEGIIAHADPERELLRRVSASPKGWAFCSPSVLLGDVLRKLGARPQRQRGLGLDATDMVVVEGAAGVERSVVDDPQPGDMWRSASGQSVVVVVVDALEIVVSIAGEPLLLGAPVSIPRPRMRVSFFGASFVGRLPPAPPNVGDCLDVAAVPVGTVVHLVPLRDIESRGVRHDRVAVRRTDGFAQLVEPARVRWGDLSGRFAAAVVRIPPGPHADAAAQALAEIDPADPDAHLRAMNTVRSFVEQHIAAARDG